MSFPDAKACLKVYLGCRFHFADWKSAFDAVFEVEDNIPATVAVIKTMAAHAIATTTSSSPAAPAPSPNLSIAPLSQLQGLEANLIHAVDSLQRCKHIHGTAPTLEDLLNPIKETKIGHSDYWFPGGDDEIIAEAHCATTDVQDEDADEAEEEGQDEGPLAKEGQRLCEQLEKLCLYHSDADRVLTLALQQQLRKLRAHLHWLEFAPQTQVTLDKFWGAPFSSTTSIIS